MIPEATSPLRLALLSAELVVNLVELTPECKQRIDAKLSSGNALSIPIQASELFAFSTPSNQKENSTPSVALSASTRMISIFWVAENAMLGSLTENPVYFQNLKLKKLRVNYGSKIQERLFSFDNDDRNAKLGYSQSLNALGGGADLAFIELDTWVDRRCIHCFDVTSSTLVGKCLQIRPNAETSHKSLSINYEFGEMLTQPYQLIMITDKDKSLLINPDYSLELIDIA